MVVWAEFFSVPLAIIIILGVCATASIGPSHAVGLLAPWRGLMVQAFARQELDCGMGGGVRKVVVSCRRGDFATTFRDQMC